MTISANQSIGDLALKTLTRLSDRIVKSCKKAEREDDPELIHQIRVNLRKLRAAIDLFESILIFPKEISDKKVGRVARDLGKKRDNDVLIEKFKVLSPPNNNTLSKKTNKEFDKQNKKAGKKLARTLESKQFKKIVKSIILCVKDPMLTPTAAKPVKNIIEGLLHKRINRVKKHKAWEIIHEIDLGSDINLLFVEERGDIIHDLRKTSKQLRYQLEFVESVSAPGNKALLELLQKLQGHLGVIQDMRILKTFLDKSLGHKWIYDFSSIFENILANIRSNIFEARKLTSQLQGDG